LSSCKTDGSWKDASPHPAPIVLATSSNSYKVMEELARKGVVIPPVQDFTCNSCELRPECEYAWDLYNVEGDCLAAK